MGTAGNDQRGLVRYPGDDDRFLQAAFEAAAPQDLWGFLRCLVIPSATGPRMFGHCMADFQTEFFTDLVPSLHAVRDGRMPRKRRFWCERTKKASKDGDLGACLLWLAAFPKRPLYIQVGAADRDQAGIVKRRIQDLLHYNGWLNEHVEINRYKIRHKQGLAEIDILASDIAGSHGETPDLLVCNEISHVTKWEFLENLLDNAAGVPRGVVVIATNAGFLGSMAHKWRQNAEQSPEWSLHVWNKPSPWLSPADIEDAKARNTLTRFNRLFYGRWASGKGDALDEETIERCICLSGPEEYPVAGYSYIAGLDLGISHDHAALVVLAVSNEHREIKLVYMRAFEPLPLGDKFEVNLIEVEDEIKRVHARYHLRALYYDPYQAKLMAQHLRRMGLLVKDMTFTGNNLTLMANTFLQVLKSGELLAYDDQEGRLRRDFGKFCIAEKSYGYKLEAVSDEFGHADVGTALVIALPHAVSWLDGNRLLPTDDLRAADTSPLTPDEVAEMPDELREIVEANRPYQRRRMFHQDFGDD